MAFTNLGRIIYRKDLEKFNSFPEKAFTEYIEKNAGEAIRRSLDFLFEDITCPEGDVNLNCFFFISRDAAPKVRFSDDLFGLVLVTFPEQNKIDYKLNQRDIYSNTHIMDVDPLIVNNTNPAMLMTDSPAVNVSVKRIGKRGEIHLPGHVVGGIFCRRNLLGNYHDQKWLRALYAS